MISHEVALLLGSLAFAFLGMTLIGHGVLLPWVCWGIGLFLNIESKRFR